MILTASWSSDPTSMLWDFVSTSLLFNYSISIVRLQISNHEKADKSEEGQKILGNEKKGGQKWRNFVKI